MSADRDINAAIAAARLAPMGRREKAARAIASLLRGLRAGKFHFARGEGKGHA